MRQFRVNMRTAAEPLTVLAMRNLYPSAKAEGLPPVAADDIYGDLQPAYRAILVRRLQRYLQAPREIPPARGFVE